MQGLFLETALVILEKSTLHSSQAHVYILYCSHVWNNILGSWLQKVNRKSVFHLQDLLSSTCFFSHKSNGFEPDFRKRQQDLLNAIGSMYVAVLFLGVQNATSVQPVIAIERTVFYRERAAGMYSALPYAFGQVQICIPYK